MLLLLAAAACLNQCKYLFLEVFHLVYEKIDPAAAAVTRAQVMNLSAMIVLMSASLSPLEISAELKEVGGKKRIFDRFASKIKVLLSLFPSENESIFNLVALT